MAPTPLGVTHRLTLFYTSLLLPHQVHFHVDAFPTLLFASGWGITGWDLINTDVQDLADLCFNGFKAQYKAGNTSFDGWELDEWDAGAWVYRAAGGTTVTPTGTGTNSPGMQFVVTIKDDHNKFMRWIMQESEVPLPFKASGNTAVIANEPFAGSLISNVSPDAGNWVRSRGGNKLQRCISFVVSTNRKTRRRRGIA